MFEFERYKWICNNTNCDQIVSYFVFVVVIRPKTKIILFNNSFNCLYLLIQLINISVASSFHHLQYLGNKNNIYFCWEHNVKLGRGHISSLCSVLYYPTLL